MLDRLASRVKVAPCVHQDGIRQRIEVIQGSHGDAATIEKALNGADALFWLIPPDPFMALNRVDEAYADFTKPAAKAITNCAVKRVVSVCEIGCGWNKEARLVTANIKADDVIARTGVALRTLMIEAGHQRDQAVAFSVMKILISGAGIAGPTLALKPRYFSN